MTGGSQIGKGSRAWLVALITGVSVISAAAVIAAALVVGTRHMSASSTQKGALPPMDMASVPANIAGNYEFAAQHLALYAQVPCYCGCHSSLGHRGLQDCFVKADGSGWESHASGCGVCIQESEMVRTLVAKGRSPTEIRDAVIAKFGGQS
jgi:Protein of unknown function with PCYCGC motif